MPTPAPPPAPFAQPRPPKRPLRIFAFDPMLGLSPQARVTIQVRNEPLQPGPVGERVVVVDYDGANDCYYEPVDLEDTNIVMQDGLDPSSSDPRFHQQMVYAVATNVLENFDFALGRRIKFKKNRPLRIMPHAFQGANAYYDPELGALLFGYFKADENDPGENIPGQTIFTCLSQDIIAHEMTHALVDRLRPRFLEASNGDVAAFHEGFADIVAIFQHFSFPNVLREVIQRQHADLRSNSPLVELAAQFGHASGHKRALRSAIDEPDARALARVVEPHARGSILVGAVFDAFFAIYQKRIEDLVRIATGGSGRLPDGNLQPDLVNRIATEAQKAAQQILTMCIRAFDYLPPVDITFGDYLRALITADFELMPEDVTGVRQSVIEAFRKRGIYPAGVTSLAEESLLWEERPALQNFPVDLLFELVRTAQGLKRTTDARRENAEGAPVADADAEVERETAIALHAWAVKNAKDLGLEPSRKIRVEGFHSAFRVGPDGRLNVELVAQFAQQDLDGKDDLGGLPFRGGVTVVAAADGRVRYVIEKRMTRERREKQRDFVSFCDARDPSLPWAPPEYLATRMATRMRFRDLHDERF